MLVGQGLPGRWYDGPLREADGLRRVFAYLGCIVTVMSLTYSTFTQQVICLELRPISPDIQEPSNLNRTGSWAAWTGAWDEGG